MFATIVGVKLAGLGKIERDVVVTESISLYNLHRVFQWCLHSSFSDDKIAAIVRYRTAMPIHMRHRSATGPHIASIILLVSLASPNYTGQGWTALESAWIEPACHTAAVQSSHRCSHMLLAACMQPFTFKYGKKALKGAKGTQLCRVAGGTTRWCAGLHKGRLAGAACCMRFLRVAHILLSLSS